MKSQTPFKLSCVLIVLFGLGCEKAAEMMNPPPPVSTPPVTQNVARTPPVVVETPKPMPAPVVDKTPDPIVIKAPKSVLVPRFRGALQRLVTPKMDGRKRGAEFSLVILIEGQGSEAYQYEVEVRDQNGATMKFPATVSDGRLAMSEFVVGAGVQGKYEFQIFYFDLDTGTRTPLLEDRWGHFSLNSD